MNSHASVAEDIKKAISGTKTNRDRASQLQLIRESHSDRPLADALRNVEAAFMRNDGSGAKTMVLEIIRDIAILMKKPKTSTPPAEDLPSYVSLSMPIEVDGDVSEDDVKSMLKKFASGHGVSVSDTALSVDFLYIKRILGIL